LALERGSELIGVEVKAGATVRWSDARSLAALRDSLGVRFRLGIIAYLGEEPLVLGDRICAVPAWLLAGVHRWEEGGKSVSLSFARMHPDYLFFQLRAVMLA